jgi:hypothetical protein
MLEINYSGSRGTGLETTREFNGTPLQYLSTKPTRDDATNNYLTTNMPNPFAGLLPGTSRNGSTISRAALMTMYPHFTNTTTTTNQGFSTYHALAINVDKRFSKGWTIQGGYTFSKFMEATGYLNSMDRMPNYVISDQDVPQRFSLSFIYELPFGKGRRFLANSGRATNAILGGWQLQGIHVRQAGSALGFGNMLLYGTLDQIPLPKDQRNIDRWFNTSVFERSNTKALVSNVRVAAARFAGIRAPGSINYDLSILKNTRINEKMRFEIRGEFLNATNTPFFAAPNTDQYSTSFGTITSQRGYSRRVQLGAKFIY